MKKTFLVFMMLTMAAASCQTIASAENGVHSEAAEADSAASGEESTAEVKMLNDLVGYIYQSENMYGDMQWVLDAFERFDAEKSWENLQLARASLAIAKDNISMYSLPESEMTVEDQMELMRRGIDVSFMENMEAAFEGEKTTLLNTCGNLHYSVMDGVFLQGDWDVSMQHVRLLKDLTACDIQYLANTADWVLATLNDDEITERFSEVMDTYCPLTHACQAEKPESPEAVEEVTDSLLDHVGDLLIDEAKILGAHSNRLNLMTELVEQEDYLTMGKDLLEISDMPPVLFYPTWYDDEDIHYFWKENDEIIETPAPGTTLERVPDICLIRTKGVSADEVLDYQEELEKAGLPCLGSTEDDGKLSILYEYQGNTFVLICEDESVEILMTDDPVCFVPRWYLPACDAVK